MWDRRLPKREKKIKAAGWTVPRQRLNTFFQPALRVPPPLPQGESVGGHTMPEQSQRGCNCRYRPTALKRSVTTCAGRQQWKRRMGGRSIEAESEKSHNGNKLDGYSSCRWGGKSFAHRAGGLVVRPILYSSRLQPDVFQGQAGRQRRDLSLAQGSSS